MKKIFLFLLFQFALFIHLTEAQISFVPAAVASGNNPTALELFYGTLNSTSSIGQNIALRLTCSTQGQVFANIKSKVFNLPAGSTEITVKNSADLLYPANVMDSLGRFLNYDVRTSSFPPGNYNFCLYVLTAFGGETLGQKCFSMNIEALPKAILLSPENKSRIHNIIPIFSWSKIIEAGSVSAKGITYSIKVVEMKEGQTPMTALESSPDAIHEAETNLNTFQFPTTDAFMEPCKNYAWQVSAFLGSGKSKSGVTKSEPWNFSIDCDGGVTYISREDTKPKSQNQSGDAKKSELEITRTNDWPSQYVIDDQVLIEATDTLMLKVPNKYPSGSIDGIYKVANLTTNKMSSPKTITLKADRSMVKFQIPCNETDVKIGETGLVIMRVGKDVYYNKFIRVPEEERKMK
jgi:hypothetical protein